MITAMAIVGTLCTRNLGVFLRSRTAVVFAISPVVLCCLFLAFFREPTVSMISGIVSGTDAYAAADAWIFGSVAMLSGFSSTMSVLTGFLEDRRSGRFGLQLASSVKKWQLVWGYLLSAIIVAIVMSVVIVIFGQIWALANGQPLMRLGEWLMVLMAIILSAILFTGINAIALRFLVLQGAFGAYCLIMGTVAGIMSFSYVLPRHGVSSAAGVLPFLQAAVLVRDPMLTPVSRGLDPDTVTDLNTALGAAVDFGGIWPQILVIFVLLAWSAIVLVVGSSFLRRCLKN